MLVFLRMANPSPIPPTGVAPPPPPFPFMATGPSPPVSVPPSSPPSPGTPPPPENPLFVDPDLFGHVPYVLRHVVDPAFVQRRLDAEFVRVVLLGQQAGAPRRFGRRALYPNDHITNGYEKKDSSEEANIETKDRALEFDDEGDSGNEVLHNGTADESITSLAESDARHSGNAPAIKLGFGLTGSGKRAAVLSFFHEEDDDANKDKKMRPLVPIDYSTEELQAVQSPVSSGQPPNLVTAAEFTKRISNVTKEEKPDVEKERRRSHDRSSQRQRDRNDDDNKLNDEKDKILERDRIRERGLDKIKTPDKQKLLDAKQLIDMIPKTKDELFSYEINWAVYDKHELHERMRPWISKKVTEFLGEEEATLVDYIVSSTQLTTCESNTDAGDASVHIGRRSRNVCAQDVEDAYF